MASIFTPEFSQKLGDILETLDEESKQCVIKAIGILNGSDEKKKEINKHQKQIDTLKKEIAEINSLSVAINPLKQKKSEGSFGCDFRNRLNKIPMGEAINLGYKCKKCPKYYWGKTTGEKHESKCTGKKSFEQIDNETNRLLWRPS